MTGNRVLPELGALPRRAGRSLLGLFSQPRRRSIRGSRRRNFLLGEDGQSTVEVAITLPILLAFIFGLMEVCMAFYIYESISELAREGTRYAIVHESSCTTPSSSSCTATASQIQTYVQSLGLLNSGSSSMTVAATFPDGNENPGSRVQVNVQYTFAFNIPFMPPKSLTMSSTSEMTIIQ